MPFHANNQPGLPVWRIGEPSRPDSKADHSNRDRRLAELRSNSYFYSDLPWNAISPHSQRIQKLIERFGHSRRPSYSGYFQPSITARDSTSASVPDPRSSRYASDSKLPRHEPSAHISLHIAQCRIVYHFNSLSRPNHRPRRTQR